MTRLRPHRYHALANSLQLVRHGVDPDNPEAYPSLPGEISVEKNALRELVGVIYEISCGIAIDTGVGFGLVNADLGWSVTVGITYDFRF